MKAFSVLLLFFLFLSLTSVVSLRKKQSTISVETDDNVVESTKSENNTPSKRDKLKFDEDMTEEELRALQIEETELKKKVYLAVLDHGELSPQKAAALHILGRNLYKQSKFDQVLGIAKEIVKIHEAHDGVEHKNTANALGNLASVSFRLDDLDTCHQAMRRQLYILKQTYDENSKEIMMHRGRMLTFRVPYAKTDMGISYDDYLDEL